MSVRSGKTEWVMGKPVQRTALIAWLWSATMLAWLMVAANGQQSAVPIAPLPPSSAKATESLSASLTAPIPLTEVARHAKFVSTTLRNMEASLLSDHVTETVANDLPLLTHEIDPRLDENSKIIIANPSLGLLERLASGWQQTIAELTSWNRNCAKRVLLLDNQQAHLTQMTVQWEQTLKLAQDADAPSGLQQQIENTLAAIRLMHDGIEARREQILDLRRRISEENSRIDEMLSAIKRERAEVLAGLFIQNSPPIWSGAIWAHTRQGLGAEMGNVLTSQWMALRAYVARKVFSFCLHACIIVLLAAAFYHLRGRAHALAAEEPELQHAVLVFDTPIATAILLSILFNSAIYPQAPRLLSVSLGAAALVPTILILRRLIERSLDPILNALVTFYFIGQLRDLSAASEVISRGLFLVEFLGGILFLGWLVRPTRLPRVSGGHQSQVWQTIQTGARVALLGAAVAFAANLVGYVDLANYLGSALLSSANVAAILYTLVRVIDGLLSFALYVRPLNLLGLVRRHHHALRQHARYVLKTAAIVLWTLYTLDQLGLRDPIIARAGAILNAPLTIAAFHFTLGHLVAFGLTVWAASLFSRFTRFLLDEDIYPRVHLAEGIPYAMSTLLNYLILLIGFYIAISALGFDMNRFTILAGAFGVGFGFGLQNVINNFVSGLILLFERPIKVGDVIQLEDATGANPPGVVERIGIRASIIRVTNGSEVIVPNGKLISDRVINWTYSNRRRSIEIPVSVPSGTDPERIMALLQEVALAHPLLIHDPAPEALFIKFSADTLEFELHGWTDHYEEWQRTRSELAIAIHTALVKEKILQS